MIRKKWQIAGCDKDLAAQIAQDYSLNPFAALLVASRGFKNDMDISSFFDDNPLSLIDPYELPDMKAAVDRITEAVDKNECIVIFGDYDADGVTAAALLISYLEAREANVSYYIPDRLTEGYGLSKDAVLKLKGMGATLIITVDNGVGAVEEAMLAAELGMEIIITDHHKPKDVLPAAAAVIDPHRTDCTCRFKDFAGVGVVFKLICALDGGDPMAILEEFGDLAAIGTVGDVVPLLGENRIIVKYGIRCINEYPRTGIAALLAQAGYKDKTVNSSSVAFILAPRINAAGRIGSAQRAMELLLTEDEEKAAALAKEINDANLQRQQIETDILKKVESQLNAFPGRKFEKILIADGDGWHSGVIGIVASRLVEKYGRPCIIISREGKTAKGSGRSLEGFSLYDALKAVASSLTHFGGHTLAAGMGIETDKIDEFRKAIKSYTKNIDMPFPVQRIDFKLNPVSISTEIPDEVSVLEPFGAENPQPVFGLFGMKIEGIQPVANGKYTRLILSRNGSKINAMHFGVCFSDFPYESGETVDLAINLDNNEYMGERKVNIYIRNMKLSNFNEDGVLMGLRAYEAFVRGEELTAAQATNVFPERELFSAVYKAIKLKNGQKLDFEVLCKRIGDDGSRICAVTLAVDSMFELGLIERGENDDITIIEQQKKVNLEDSVILKNCSLLSNSGF